MSVQAPLRYCSYPKCPKKVTSGRCADHAAPKRREERRHYTGIPGVNYGRKWGKLRARWLAEHPYCVQCPPDSLTFATQLDHIEPHRGSPEKFWDERNLQGLCERHHGEKTAREVGLGGSR